MVYDQPDNGGRLRSSDVIADTSRIQSLLVTPI